MKAWLTPNEHTELTRHLDERAAALHAAYARGARFLAVPVHDNLDAAEWALACFHSPIAFVPLPPDLPAAALEKRLRQLPSGVVYPEELPKLAPKERAQKNLADIWAVIFSSGTTGEPKGAALTGAALQASAEAHAQHSLAGQATWLLDLPLYHVGGLSVITRAFFLRAAIAIGPARFSATETKRWLASDRVQALSLVPTTLHRLLGEHADFSPLSLILLGGAPATPELVRRAREKNAPIRCTYGMTEHGSQIATETKSGEGLQPLPGVALCFDEHEILVRSPMLAKGYYRDGALEPLPLRDGFFPTGDLGEWRDGALVIHARKADLIISGGKKVYPAEIEAELAKIPSIQDHAVLGLEDREWGEVVCAAVVGDLDPEKTKARLREILESHKIPKHWVKVTTIPRSPSGKVLRNELRAIVGEALKPSRS